ncbi:MAG: threonine--tRNA ligase [Limnochordaceae bacterium]|nr:threonine--tRNA ligase [Limnochordaceae bacterium]
MSSEASSKTLVAVTLPDGSVLEVPAGSTAAQVAERIGRRLAQAAVAARVGGELVDLSTPVDQATTVELITLDSPEGIQILRHSCAHVLAQAVLRRYPQAKLAIGPTIEDGFYYDIDFGQPFSQEEFSALEEEMRKVIQEDLPIHREVHPRQEMIRFFQERRQPYKVEILQEITDPTVSIYRQGEFVDLCRGPHLPSTGRIKAFALLSVAGAYWRGDEKRPMLTRIYGTAFPTAAELQEHLRRVEEARHRDHRRLGRELGLFAVSDEVGQGLPLWLPKGAAIRRTLERYIVDLELRAGYEHVYTPPLARTELYKISGHWDHYRENMYPPMKVDDEELVLRPMNCPHHIMVYKQAQHSYKELPVRIAELGLMHRYERSGVLTGLARVRGMTLNDAHIFCRPDQIKDEFLRVVRLIQQVYQDLGFHDYVYTLSLRDPADTHKFVDNPLMWETAERVVREALDELGVTYRTDVGGAAFYGPKLDVDVKSVAGKYETISTVQVDFYLPERFQLEYIGADNQPHRPVMIHRGVISTMERMTAFLIELYGGAFPAWLAPVQAVVLPVADRHQTWAQQVLARLQAEDLRAEVDGRDEKLNRKIRDAEVQKVPFMLVIGDREVENGQVAVRQRGKGDIGSIPAATFVERLARLVRSRRLDLDLDRV